MHGEQRAARAEPSQWRGGLCRAIEGCGFSLGREDRAPTVQEAKSDIVKVVGYRFRCGESIAYENHLVWTDLFQTERARRGFHRDRSLPA